ncbi:GNAT family N-acetyltransferase [Paeniglutamicibacter kerguelensis]|uniref:RimJ/RimL family protein N-acetyltransferase n=1 Tax=Paeniglutamicibacter kerguelensis TaxID=254788 RepID=A0ABS4XC35_9MICC|nr:GNAT family protein [Paeniglutamicibacter kerguelensis]MBP2386025.1 RimJ/RimL family protein N-acetyltransferase [Paeniglutamicibacter kerguelensis]
MTITADPWTSAPSSPGVRVKLVQVPRDVLDALADGDLAKARSLTDLGLTPYLTTAECRGVWHRRRGQIAMDPTEAPWVTRLVVDAGTGTVVGRAGFHGKPDATGMVEIGYSIDPLFRRRGYARYSLLALIDAARHDPRVNTVRASIRPDNTPSRNLVDQYGFRVVGEQWDEEDGLETVLELNVG